jgi:hypothetical protein
VRLEELGRAGDVAGLQEAYPELADAVKDLCVALAETVANDGQAAS